MLHKTSLAAAGGIVDHPYQVTHRFALPSSRSWFAVSLHQLAVSAPPRPPLVHLFEFARLRLPQPGFHHPPAHRLSLLAWILCRLANCSLANVGPKSCHSGHHNAVAIGLHAHQQLSHSAIAHTHLFGRLRLRHHPVSRPLQPLQPISFLLVHRDSFHPSSF
jgi:hypothetical protein